MQQQQSKMDLKVKSHILSKYFISKIALNHPHNILAVLVDSADTLSFFHLAPSPTPIFQGMSKPSGKKSCLAWSNDGTYLALGSNNLELWKFDGKKMVPIKNYSEDFLDVKIVAWSPDSQSIAYGGLSMKNSIKIKNIQTGATKDILISLAVCGISFDPFGKYLLILLRNNFLYVYNSANLSKTKQIQMGSNGELKESVNTVKQIRSMGWSPDFSYLTCPSLEDSKVSIALNLSRGNGFKLKQAFMGHVSSISCARFNPNLYEYQEQITSILALGDSHGVISLWRVGKIVYPEPLLLANSNSDYHEIIDELEWQTNNCALIANVMKRYINILTFEQSCFGRKITETQMSNIIQENYGVRSAAEINQKKLEVFSLASLTYNNTPAVLSTSFDKRENVANQPVAPSAQFEPSKVSQPQLTFDNKQQQYVKVNEQVTLKDKNNRKRIQPAMLVRKDEVPKHTQNTQPLPLKKNLHLYSTIGTFQPLNLKPIRLDQQLIKVSKQSYLQIRKIQGYSIVKLYGQQDNQRSLVAERVFTGMIDWLKIVGGRIYFLNLGNLYVFGLNLNLLDLPYNLGDIHKIVLNTQGDIYYISPKGLIKGFNHQDKTCYTPIPVTLQSLIEGVKWKPNQKAASEEVDEFQKVVDDCWVEDNHNLYVNLSGSKNRYYYCRSSQCWVTLELNSGLLQPGNSLRIGEQQRNLCQHFFRSLTLKFLPQSPSPAQTPIQQFESNMIYYRKHHPSRQQYIQNLIGLLKELKLRNNTDRLRSEICKYFVNRQSGCYEEDERVRQKVKQIGGSVIQQFVLFGQL